MVRVSEVLTAGCVADAVDTASPRWQRFTLLDFAIFVLCYAYAAEGALRQQSETAGYLDSPWVQRLTTTDVVLQTLAAGSVSASIFVLAAQYVLRRRRTGLSLGEVQWLMPAIVCLLTVAMLSKSGSGEWNLCVLGCAVVAVSTLALAAPFYLAYRLIAGWEHRTCRWTDVFGPLASISAGVLVVYDVVAHPLVI
jgi:hypothetical protein